MKTSSYFQVVALLIMFSHLTWAEPLPPCLRHEEISLKIKDSSSGTYKCFVYATNSDLCQAVNVIKINPDGPDEEVQFSLGASSIEVPCQY